MMSQSVSSILISPTGFLIALFTVETLSPTQPARHGNVICISQNIYRKGSKTGDTGDSTATDIALQKYGLYCIECRVPNISKVSLG